MWLKAYARPEIATVCCAEAAGPGPSPPATPRRCEASRDGLGAVALLVLLARTAPAGVVAADLLVLGLDDRGRVGAPGRCRCLRSGAPRRRRRPRPPPWRPPPRWASRDRRGPLLAAGARVLDVAAAAGLLGAEHLLGLGRLDVDLDVEDHPDELLPDRGHELLEHVVALVLVRDQGVDLGEAAQVDALAQVVHLVEVLAPAVVDDLEQDLALEVAHQLLAELLLARGRRRRARPRSGAR